MRDFTAQTPRVIGADRDKTISVAGGTSSIRLSMADTNGALALIECRLLPHGAGPAPHWHAHASKVCYVTEGTLAWSLDETTVVVPQNTSILVPPRVVHTFWNPTAAPASVLIWITPAGSEELFAELFATDGTASSASWSQYDTFAPDMLTKTLPAQ